MQDAGGFISCGYRPPLGKVLGVAFLLLTSVGTAFLRRSQDGRRTVLPPHIGRAVNIVNKDDSNILAFLATLRFQLRSFGSFDRQPRPD